SAPNTASTPNIRTTAQRSNGSRCRLDGSQMAQARMSNPSNLLKPQPRSRNPGNALNASGKLTIPRSSTISSHQSNGIELARLLAGNCTLSGGDWLSDAASCEESRSDF